MATVSQIHANRRNSQKSTGPKSDEGKAISAKNAIKHGLFALETLIKGENREEFEHFREHLLEEFDPQGAVEAMLAERIISLGWRLKRIVRIQDQVFDVMIEKDEPSPLSKRMRLMMPKEMRDDRRGAGPELVLGRAAIDDFSNSRVLERLLMYERRIENSLNKTMDELHKRKLIRQLEQANKEIETGDFEMPDHPQPIRLNAQGSASLEAATQLTEDRGRRAEDRKNGKQSQLLRQNTESRSQETEGKMKTVPIT